MGHEAPEDWSIENEAEYLYIDLNRVQKGVDEVTESSTNPNPTRNPNPNLDHPANPHALVGTLTLTGNLI